MLRGRITKRAAILWAAFAVGICIMAYPFVSNLIYQWKADELLRTLAAQVDQGSHEDYQAELERAAIYNATLVGQTVPDVFAIREGTTDVGYEGHLNVAGDGVMGSIQIPVIDVNLPIYHYSTEESLQKGCGHIFGSSLPVGGESSHAVITAHRGLPAAKLFTDLDQVEKKDRVYLHILDQVLAYEVDDIEVVAPTETRSLAIQPGKDLITLVTCTPYGINTDRLLVHCHRVPYVEGEEGAAVPMRPAQLLRIALYVGCVALGVAVALGIRVLTRRMRERGEASAAEKREEYVSLYGATLFSGDADELEGPDIDELGEPADPPRRGKHFRE